MLPKHLQEPTHSGRYVLCLLAGTHLGRYVNGGVFPSVTLPASTPAARRRKGLSTSALAPPLEPFVSVGTYHPTSSRLPQGTSRVLLAAEAGKACYGWKTICVLRGRGWQERRRICGQPSSTARGSQVARDGRFV